MRIGLLELYRFVINDLVLTARGAGTRWGWGAIFDYGLHLSTGLSLDIFCFFLVFT